jgi:hypothetical protein
VKGVSRQKCTLESWSGSTDPSAVARENGMDKVIAYEEHDNGMKYGFLNWGKKKAKGFGVYDFDDKRN